MKIVVTMVHEVEAESWGEALEKVLLAPAQDHLAACRVKAPGLRLQHVMPSTVKIAVAHAVRGKLGIEP
jgi:hypothetical protein